MTVKAKLKIQLLANSVVVAESEDRMLWQRVLGAIQKGIAVKGGDGSMDLTEDEGLLDEPLTPKKKDASKGVAAFAKELVVPIDELVGACSPSKDAPFLHLDARYWEALRDNTGSRGRSAVAPIGLAGTLLGLWFKHADIQGHPTVQQCQDVLNTIGLRDQNSSRSLRNTDWLQNRSGSVVINPAQWSTAVRVAKAYCLKIAPKDVE